MNEVLKQILIFIGFFLLAIVLNSLFQTACQQWLGIPGDGLTRCRLTEPLNGTVYMVIVVILAIALDIGFQKWRIGKKKQ